MRACWVAGWCYGACSGCRAWPQGHCGAAAGAGRRHGGQGPRECDRQVLLRDGPREASRACQGQRWRRRAGASRPRRGPACAAALAWAHGGRGAMERRGAVTCGRAGSQDGATALVLAAERGHKDTVELLVERGANLEAKNNVKSQRQLSLPCPGSAGDLCIVCNGVLPAGLSPGPSRLPFKSLAVADHSTLVALANGLGCLTADWQPKSNDRPQQAT